MCIKCTTTVVYLDIPYRTLELTCAYVYTDVCAHTDTHAHIYAQAHIHGTHTSMGSVIHIDTAIYQYSDRVSCRDTVLQEYRNMEMIIQAE